MQTIIIAQTNDNLQIETIKAFFKALKIKFKVTKESSYNLEFVAKIERSRKQAEKGETFKMNLDDIWKK